MIVRVSKHIIVKPKEYQKDSYVDATGIDFKDKALTRGSLHVHELDMWSSQQKS